MSYQKMAEIVANNEQTVLNIINEYLDKNRFFSANDIVPFISSRFAKSDINININGIRTILKSLVEKNFIVEGSKLTRNEILTNINRKKIYEYIQKNPGSHFNKIVSKKICTNKNFNLFMLSFKVSCLNFNVSSYYLFGYNSIIS